jgi:hypothetical protein
MPKGWTPDLSAWPEKKGDCKILWEAFQKIQPAQLQDRLEDDVGLFAINTDKGVLCAKKETYGFIVSCHERVVHSACNQKKRIIMFIKKGEHFYSFEPEKVLKSSEPNIRGGMRMLNFQIKLGERYHVLGEKTVE